MSDIEIPAETRVYPPCGRMVLIEFSDEDEAIIFYEAIRQTEIDNA